MSPPGRINDGSPASVNWDSVDASSSESLQELVMTRAEFLRKVLGTLQFLEGLGRGLDKTTKLHTETDQIPSRDTFGPSMLIKIYPRSGTTGPVSIGTVGSGSESARESNGRRQEDLEVRLARAITLDEVIQRAYVQAQTTNKPVFFRFPDGESSWRGYSVRKADEEAHLRKEFT